MTQSNSPTVILGGTSNSDDCGCNDYSLLTANTGINTASVANPNLDGITGPSGGYVTVYTSPVTDSIIKSITIKATEPTLQGMVRLFIVNNGATVVTLYKEVPVNINPQVAAVGLPVPTYLMFETVLCGDLKLPKGFSIIASTQTAQTFNIIVEGLYWTYPETLPDSCCNYRQDEANIGSGVVSVANKFLDGSGTIQTIFTADSTSNGSLITAVTIKAMGSTHEGAIRLFISPGGTPAWKLLHEVWIPQTTQSGFDPSFKCVIPANFNLKEGYLIGASTQIGESYSITIEGEDWSYPIS